MARKKGDNYTSVEIYKFYKKNYNTEITKAVFTDILRDFYSRVVDSMIYQGREFALPYKLGNVRIRKNKIKLQLDKEGNVDKRKLAPDWGAIRKLWKRIYPNKSWSEIVTIQNKPMVYHENKHTDRYQHKWHWDKTTCLVKNNSAYSLNIARGNDRKLAKALKEEGYKLDYSIY
jgi:hypothetical protein